MRKNDIARVLGATCSEKDFPEDWQGENGTYTCQCVNCGDTFIGHKRRVLCKECSATVDSTAQKGKV